MLRTTLIAALAASLVALPATAESESPSVIVDWGHMQPSIPAYHDRSTDMPLTGAARFGASQATEVDVMMKADFNQRPVFENSYKRFSPPGATGAESGFVPGPELVAPTPTPVFELRGR